MTDPHASLPNSALIAALEALEHACAAKTQADTTAIIRALGRKLTGADGVCVVLRKGDRVHYVDEDAIAPLWKGQDYPMSACISGWAIVRQQTVVIEDIHLDARIPLVAYKPTFVQSLAVAPMNPALPVGALGAYWAQKRLATPEEIAALELAASVGAIAMQRLALGQQLSATLERRRSAETPEGAAA
jgi:GAF domain-containing protein